jgi:hypothetical protein
MPNAKPQQQEEVGDLFVTGASLTVKLMPSRKSASKPITWFSQGCVVNVKAAAKDISSLIGKTQGRGRVVRGLVVTTDLGLDTDLVKTRLSEAVRKAGFEVLA